MTLSGSALLKVKETRNSETIQMQLTDKIAKHLRDIHFGGNWTASNLKDKLADVTWQQATEPVGSFHTIAALVSELSQIFVCLNGET